MVQSAGATYLLGEILDCYQCSPPPGLVNRQMGIVAIRPEGLPRTAPGLGVIAHFDSASEAVLQKDPFLVNRIAMAQKMQPYTPVVGDGQTTVLSAGVDRAGAGGFGNRTTVEPEIFPSRNFRVYFGRI
ncbi:MAG: hypothetical protein A3J28_08220 [Acidobacteria bacterium RIFCSPLOWO2_12_FULL_60_22]|nr:MAG: hypothetical protein A3J28_08220 [Acidobacteria bacterium RIFCSPLOWO2_12_FULL_60_22]